jgi:hypothetical protein
MASPWNVSHVAAFLAELLAGSVPVPLCLSMGADELADGWRNHTI